ncbi:MAG TPA: DUF1761 domain-containing protein [Bacteroidales bacterium]|jgi:hypothetical protein|nr:DUF1761 domain-containing protein [Bacteroidales bacterium]
MEIHSAFQNLNWLAILVAAVSAFALGGLWYSALFAKSWAKETGITNESASRKNMGRTFGLSFVLSLVASFFLALFIGNDKGAAFGAMAGFMAGIGWVFTFIGIIYLFESKSLALFLINACYSVLSLTIMGLIIGAWQ